MSSLPSQLCGEPFISTRQSIAWIPSTPAFEDSDVLVLSSRSTSQGVGATRFYLDLRLSLPLGKTSKVNWGFAGLRRTLSTSPVRHRWDHATIDSRGDGSVDEGEVIQRSGVEIETGIGFNPAVGQMETYEEIWRWGHSPFDMRGLTQTRRLFGLGFCRDEPLPAGSPYVFVSSSANVEEATATMAVLGPHALALAQEPEDPHTPRELRAARMHRRASADEGTHAFVWEIVFSTGNPSQERELNELVELAGQACWYMRGGDIYLGSRPWIVWDAGKK